MIPRIRHKNHLMILPPLVFAMQKKCLLIGNVVRYLQNPSSANITSEETTIVKQGLSIESYMLVEILKRCSKQKTVTRSTLFGI